MAIFKIGTTVTTTVSPAGPPANFVDVEITTDAPIPPGVHHFQLIVVDEAGNKSDPVTAQIVIRDSIKPTAVLKIAPSQVEPGQPFRLDGSGSSDVAPGQVVQYIWTMVD